MTEQEQKIIQAARKVLNNWLCPGITPDVSGDFAELEYAFKNYEPKTHELQAPSGTALEHYKMINLTDWVYFRREAARDFFAAILAGGAEQTDDNIEYIRTDAFMEKAERYLKNTLYDRVEIKVFGTLIPSVVSKKEFIDNFKNYMQDESEN